MGDLVGQGWHMSAVAARPHNVIGVTDVSVGDEIRKRRVDNGLSIKALAERAGVDRGTLAAIEDGNSSARPTTIAAVLTALDAFDEETSGPYDEPAEKGQVTFKVDGNFGVRVTVQGPVENMSELREQVSRLIETMEQRRSD